MAMHLNRFHQQILGQMCPLHPRLRQLDFRFLHHLIRLMLPLQMLMQKAIRHHRPQRCYIQMRLKLAPLCQRWFAVLILLRLSQLQMDNLFQELIELRILAINHQHLRHHQSTFHHLHHPQQLKRQLDKWV
jgi:hypothetical protein